MWQPLEGLATNMLAMWHCSGFGRVCLDGMQAMYALSRGNPRCTGTEEQDL